VLKSSEEVAEYRLAVGTEVKVHSLRPHQAGDVVLLLGFVEAGILDWAPSDRLPEVVQKYVLNLPGPAATDKQRMGFFLDHLFATEQIIADDAYNEFARASLAELDAVKPLLDRAEIMRRIELEETPINRRRLYWTLMSLCGKPEDAQWIKQKLLKRRRGSEQTIGLDAAISCYLVLGGDEALKFVEQEFLLNEKTDYPDTYAAVLALRVHAQEIQVFSREQLVTAMSGLLRSSDLADLIIPDLARMEDWRHVDRMVELYAKADDKNPFVRVPVANYLRACPLPAAAEALERCREIDPSAIKRSITIFPNLGPATSP
jgi:hypothetical protein